MPAKFSTPVDNLNALSDKYGKQTERWNGFDLSANARLQNGLTLQVGLSSGKTTENNCEIVAALPEMLLTQRTAGVGDLLPASNTANSPGNQWRPAQFCDREEPMLTQFKTFGVYTIPKVDVQISGTFRSVAGTSVQAALTATNTVLAASSTLGRPLSGGVANILISIEEPNQTYTERRQELDMRFGKVLRFGRYRSVVSMDLFNALNNDATITVNQAYASYLRPTEILNARVAKLTLQFEF